MWKRRWPLAWLGPNKAGITFGFTHGREFDDPYGLLEGDGKHARHVKIRKLADANREALRHYVRQALDFDKR